MLLWQIRRETQEVWGALSNEILFTLQVLAKWKTERLFICLLLVYHYGNNSQADDYMLPLFIHFAIVDCFKKHVSKLPIWYCSIHTQVAWLHRINNDNNNNFHCLFLVYIFTIRKPLTVWWVILCKQYYTASLHNVHRSVSQSVNLSHSVVCQLANQ